MSASNGVYKCYVRRLGHNIDETDLERAFSVFGTVIYSKVIYDRDSGASRGFGFVTFQYEKSMRDAIEQINKNGIGDLIGFGSIIVEEALPRKLNKQELALSIAMAIQAKEKAAYTSTTPTL